MRTDIGTITDPTERFFAYARARHQVYLDRAAGKPQPWTDDPILGHFRFTNVFRELDATTLWCKKYVRDPLASSPPELLLAVVLFRWFNRITTGETLFCQPSLITKRSAWEQHLHVLATGTARNAVTVLRSALAQQPPPHVTGAYTINTAGLGNGMSKVDGVLAQYESFLGRDWRLRAERMATPIFGHTMRGTCMWLKETPGMGGFMAYEIACDLRYTPLLNHAADITTWANAGPGAKRGLNRVMRGFTDIEQVRRGIPENQTIAEMQLLLAASRRAAAWPQQKRVSTAEPLRGGRKDPLQVSLTNADWPVWEMREVEHTLCEFDKYERARLGQGRPRGVFAQ